MFFCIGDGNTYNDSFNDENSLSVVPVYALHLCYTVVNYIQVTISNQYIAETNDGVQC